MRVQSDAAHSVHLIQSISGSRLLPSPGICLKARLLIINDENNAPPLHVFLRRLKGFHAKVAAPIAVVRVPTKLQIDAGLNTYVISAEDSFPSSGYSVYTVSDGKIQNLCV